MAHYILRMFFGQEEVVTTTVAIVPGANSYPCVGQMINGKWKVVESLCSAIVGEYHVRVECSAAHWQVNQVRTPKSAAFACRTLRPLASGSAKLYG
jgi:hypothetical protein